MSQQLDSFEQCVQPDWQSSIGSEHSEEVQEVGQVPNTQILASFVVERFVTGLQEVVLCSGIDFWYRVWAVFTCVFTRAHVVQNGGKQ